jgi:hypothetical protein
MRRFSRRTGLWRSTVHVGIAAFMLPGLLVLPSLPALSAVGVLNTEAAAQQAPDTPKQMNGSARSMPSLLPSSATSAGGGTGKQRKTVVPKGTLRIDERTDRRPSHRDRTRPPGGSALTAEERALAGRAPTAERAASTVPAIWATFPDDESQVDTLTPLLRSEVYHTGAGRPWDVEREYTVCDVQADGSPWNCTTSPWLTWLEPYWRVPAGRLELRGLGDSGQPSYGRSLCGCSG